MYHAAARVRPDDSAGCDGEVAPEDARLRSFPPPNP
jgi:hypothetical protein